MALITPSTACIAGRTHLVCLCILALCALTSVAHAQQDERAVRAAYLFNLSKYVSWPLDSRELRICSLADDSGGRQLKRILDGKISEGRVVRVLEAPAQAEQRHCAILYFGNAPAKRCNDVLRELGNSPVLTVSDDPQFIHQGGMVGLIRADDQIQLQVNLDAVRSTGIQMSSRLLSIAVIVRAGGANR